ncbi:NlpC/P60 family protein [Marinibacterium profundimaris]|uniref:Peptidase n=1 Tax=Marinibacterium profundimaris TaxID=1679460 RepID=A0A225NRQ6_9RHOB|nr:NlpC/P60 family protein [Marinibacterium profundimaris]OWU77509.1 peptidase [Marinibacterium profundimaris]
MSRVVEIARGWIGTPYRHQASCNGAGTDCLGLIRGVWRDLLGPEPAQVPAYSMDWSEPQGEERLWAAAMAHLVPRAGRAQQAGDVVLFRMRSGAVAKHLGIVSVPHESFIHAYTRRGVIESSMSQPWARRIVARFAFPDRSG